MVFSLANLLFILDVILTNLWSLPMSALEITSQFVTIPFWLLNVKSIWFLVSPLGDSQVQHLFFFLGGGRWGGGGLLKQCICYDQFVFLCKFNRAIPSFISLPYFKCSHAFEVFFFYFSSNFCIGISCNDLVFGVTFSHCSFNIIIKLSFFYSQH